MILAVVEEPSIYTNEIGTAEEIVILLFIHYTNFNLILIGSFSNRVSSVDFLLLQFGITIYLVRT